jgi:hypothetical protein
MCQTCHQSYQDAQTGAMHEAVIANLGPDQTCQTCHDDTWPLDTAQNCETCHGILSSDITLVSGETLSVHVETETILNSVHGNKFNRKTWVCPLTLY